MANKLTLLKIGIIAIFSVVMLAGCGEKEPEAKVENPGAANSPSVGAAVSSGGPTAGNAPSGEISAGKGAPPGHIEDHK